MDAETFLKQILAEAFAGRLDLRDRSAISELLIKPHAILLRPLDADLAEIRRAQDLSHWADMDEASLDVLAGNHLVLREPGNRATTAVRLEFDTPRTLRLKAGREYLTRTGLIFRQRQDYEIGAAVLQTRRTASGHYVTDDIPLEAAAEGTQYIVGADEIIDVVAPVPGLVRVTNPSPATGGSPRASNAELFALIQASTSTRQVLNQPGTFFRLKARFPSLTDVLLIGHGDPEMRRDETFELAGRLGSASVADFRGKVLFDPTNPSAAWVLRSTQKTPPPSAFSQELSQADYVALGSRGDARLVEVRAGDVFFDDFTRTAPFAPQETRLTQDADGSDTLRVESGLHFQRGDLVEIADDDSPPVTRAVLRVSAERITCSQTIPGQYEFAQDARVTRLLREQAVGNDWLESEHGLPLGIEADGFQASVVDGQLVLGRASYATDSSLRGVPDAQLETDLKTLVKASLVQAGYNPQDTSAVRDQVEALTFNGLVGAVKATQVISVSPVVQRPIPQPSGLKITGRCRTTDPSTEGKYCFLHVRKNASGTASYWEGFGIAWRKATPDVAPATATTADTAEDDPVVQVADALAFPEKGVAYLAGAKLTYTGRTDTSFTGCAGVTASTAPANVVRARLNVFVVDNSDLPGNPDAWLAATVADLEVDVDYQFELLLNPPSPAQAAADASALELRLWDAQEVRPATETLQYGAYVPIAARTGDTDHTHFGLAVADCVGGQWTFDDLAIESVARAYAHHLYRFSADPFPGRFRVTTRCRGTGDDAGMAGDGVVLHLWHEASQSWQEAAGHQDPALQDLESASYEVADHRDADGFVQVLLSTLFPHSAAHPAVLHVDYAAILDDATAGFHVGGKTDVLVRSTDRLVRAAVDLTDVSRIEYLSPANGFTLPLAAIESVSRLDAGGQPVGDPLVDGEDFSLFVGLPGLRYSVREHNALLFAPDLLGHSVRVTCLRFPLVGEVQALLDAPDERTADGDWLARGFRPVFVDLTVEAFGFAQSQEDLADTLARHIDALTNRIDVTGDVTRVLLEAGAEDVSTPITLHLEEHLADGTVRRSTTQDWATIARDARYFARDIRVTRAQ